MKKAVTTVVMEKYMDTEIDVLVFHFGDTKEESFISEYPIPDGYHYIVKISSKHEGSFPDWIEIVNPKAVLEREDSPLPNISVIFHGRSVDLRNAIKESLPV